MDPSKLMQIFLQNVVPAKMVAQQMGLPDTFVDTAVQIVSDKQTEHQDEKTAASLAAFEVMNEFKRVRAAELEKKPNQLLVQCKTCSAINRVTMK